MHLNRLVSALSALVLLSSSLGAAAATKWEEEYAQAVAAYQQKDYAKSSGLFWKSITDGNGNASAWFYLAHSKAGEGKLKEARDGYQQVVNIYKGTPEAAASVEFIKRLDAHTWNPGPPAGAAKTETAPGKTAPVVTSVPASVGFRYRIEIIPPRDGHPAVSGQTVALIQRVIDGLPRSVYRVLDQKGARVFLGPNIIDKWPDCLNDPKPGAPGETLPEEPGRTYGRDVYIYERKVVSRGSRELAEPYPADDIKAYFLHEIGHALDDCLGGYSKDPALKIQYKMDCDSLGEDQRESMTYFLQGNGGDAGAAEACAESVMIMLGGSKRNSENVSRAFRRTSSWVRNKLGI